MVRQIFKLRPFVFMYGWELTRHAEDVITCRNNTQTHVTITTRVRGTTLTLCTLIWRVQLYVRTEYRVHNIQLSLLDTPSPLFSSSALASAEIVPSAAVKMMHPSRQAYVEEVEPEVSPSPSNSIHRRYSYGYSRVGGMPVFFIWKTL